MLRYFLQRLLLIPVLLFLFSVMVFALVQAPPGDYLTSYIATLSASGSSLDDAEIKALEQQFGLDQPVHIQYLRWIQSLLAANWACHWNISVQIPN
jgi:peptide/nickel transport system permease protein